MGHGGTALAGTTLTGAALAGPRLDRTALAGTSLADTSFVGAKLLWRHARCPWLLGPWGPAALCAPQRCAQHLRATHCGTEL